MRQGAMAKLPLDAVTALISSLFDRAALAIEAGAPAQDYRAAIEAVVEGLVREPE
jgi:hypothetical protein